MFEIFFTEEINKIEIKEIIDEEEKKDKTFFFVEIDMIKGLIHKEDYIHEKSKSRKITKNLRKCLTESLIKEIFC